MESKWKAAIEIIKMLEINGHDAYFVGGCVRDSLLNNPIKDIDITTSALPEEVSNTFENVIPTGIEHGTVLVRHHQQSFEVTTFRTEGNYSDQRRPDEVTFVPNIKKDLARRDFTINAMAMDKEGQIIDLYGGKNDLKAHVINTVGEAKARFKEDALRILRALRFASQLGFTIEAQTFLQIKLSKEEVEHVAIERVKEECEKLFQGTYVQSGIALLHAAEMDRVLPIFSKNPELLKKAPLIVKPFASFADVIALFHYLDPKTTIQTWIKEWRCSNKEKRRAKAICTHLNYFNENGLDDWLSYQIKEEHIDAFCQLVNILYPKQQTKRREIYRRKDILPIRKKEDIDIDGHLVAALFPNQQRGQWIAIIMENLEYLIVTKQLENKQSIIKEWILCHPPDKS